MGRRRRKNLAQVLPALFSVYHYFWKDIRQQRKLIFYSLGTLMCSVVFRILEPWPLKFLLDYVFYANQQIAGSTIRTPQSLSPVQILIGVSLAVVILSLLRAVTDYASRVGFFNVGNRVVIRVRNRVYRHLQMLPLSFHDRARSGDLIIRVTRDVSLLRDVAATAILPLVGSSLVLVGMIGVMFWLRWQLALLAIAVIPVFWLTTVRIGRRIRESARKQREREGAMAAIASEAVGAIRAVKALSLEENFAADFGRRNCQNQRDDLKASRLTLRLSRTIDVLLAVAAAAVLGFGGALVFQSQLSPGDLVIFIVYLKRAFKPAQEFAKYSARIAKATAAGERVIRLLQVETESQPVVDLVTPRDLPGKIEFRHVSFGYSPDNLIIRDLNLQIEPEKTVAIVGPSGAGKSSLISLLLLRLYEPVSGSVFIDDQEIAAYRLASLRSSFAVVLQDPMLFAGSIRNNIEIGQNALAEDELKRIARLAGIDEFVEQLPDGFDTLIGERGVTLSRGQLQRIAIARAAARSAPMLLLDEPTTGLDETTEQFVSEALLRLARGRTTILVTHNLLLASQADEVIYFAEGEVIQHGSHQSLMREDGRYSQTFHARRLRESKWEPRADVSHKAMATLEYQSRMIGE